MGERQPDVERHQTRLRAHPDQRGERDRDLHARAGGDDARIADRALAREKQDRHPRPRPGEVRQRDVEEHRTPGELVRAGNQDHRRGNERHRLPRDEEGERVARHQDERLHRARTAPSAPRSPVPGPTAADSGSRTRAPQRPTAPSTPRKRPERPSIPTRGSNALVNCTCRHLVRGRAPRAHLPRRARTPSPGSSARG